MARKQPKGGWPKPMPHPPSDPVLYEGWLENLLLDYLRFRAEEEWLGPKPRPRRGKRRVSWRHPLPFAGEQHGPPHD